MVLMVYLELVELIAYPVVLPLIRPLVCSGGSQVAVTAVPFPLSGFTSKFSGGPEGAV